jgi:hypothetical protein
VKTDDGVLSTKKASEDFYDRSRVPAEIMSANHEQRRKQISAILIHEQRYRLQMF